MDALADAFASEFARTPGPTEAVIIVRILGAAIFSAIIGIERELREQAAGLRTNMLVGIASAVFGIIGITLIAQYRDGPDHIRIDPLRLIEAVTGGVAFLVAGLIVFTHGRVRGLTTGAGVWLAAAAGLATGLGQWFLAAAAAIGGILVLAALRALEKAVGLRDARSSEDDPTGD